MIELHKFSETDFDRLISWINSEEELIQFAGQIFSFPLTKEQLSNYISEPNRFVFKVILTETNEVIGHCEIFKESDSSARLCRILIGQEKYRGKGLGKMIVKKLIDFCNEQLNIYSINLNVFDWNISAIKCYEKMGFVKSQLNENPVLVNGKSWLSINMKLEN
jgi:RimJ/RimL family protein N-acetyltransferase